MPAPYIAERLAETYELTRAGWWLAGWRRAYEGLDLKLADGTLRKDALARRRCRLEAALLRFRALNRGLTEGR